MPDDVAPPPQGAIQCGDVVRALLRCLEVLAAGGLDLARLVLIFQRLGSEASHFGGGFCAPRGAKLLDVNAGLRRARELLRSVECSTSTTPGAPRLSWPSRPRG